MIYSLQAVVRGAVLRGLTMGNLSERTSSCSIGIGHIDTDCGLRPETNQIHWLLRKGEEYKDGDTRHKGIRCSYKEFDFALIKVVIYVTMEDFPPSQINHPGTTQFSLSWRLLTMVFCPGVNLAGEMRCDLSKANTQGLYQAQEGRLNLYCVPFDVVVRLGAQDGSFHFQAVTPRGEVLGETSLHLVHLW